MKTIEFDIGPTKPIARIFADLPDYSSHKDSFWFDWDRYFTAAVSTRVQKLCALLPIPDLPKELDTIV